MIRSNHLGDSVADVLSEGIGDGEEPVLVVNPSREGIRALVGLLDPSPEPPHARLFADEDPLDALADDFLIASAIADLVESGTLAIRTLPSVPNNALLVSRESVASLVAGEERAAGLVTTDPGFVAATYERYDRRWADAPSFSLRTPPISTVFDTLATDIGESTASDFRAVVDALEEVSGDGFDEVTVSLLVAARNERLFYDISKWGEDVGLASKATFSRTKTDLEERGLIDTEKVPIDVGRPRLRLLLDDERLRGTSPGEFARTSRRLLE